VILIHCNINGKNMSKRLILIISIFAIAPMAGCISIYHYVKEKRDKNYQEGVALYNQYKFAEARDRFQTVVDIEPNYRNARSYLSRTERLLKMKAKYITQRANVNYNKGIGFMRYGQYETALGYLLEAQKEDPFLVDVDEKIDQCRKKLQPRVKQMLRTAQWQYEHRLFLYAYWSCVKAKTYAPSSLEAAQLLSKTEDRLDEKAKKFRIRGKEYYAKKQYTAAKYQFQLALANYPGDEESRELLDKVNGRLNLDKYYNNAIAQYNAGNYFGARSLFQTVSNIEPRYKATNLYRSRIDAALLNQVPMFYQEGVTLYEKGNYQAAITEFNKVLSINPEHTMAKEYRLRARSKLELEKSLKGAAR
jgi:tetratricopeptide (TPR) repeat protein